MDPCGLSKIGTRWGLPSAVINVLSAVMSMSSADRASRLQTNMEKVLVLAPPTRPSVTSKVNVLFWKLPGNLSVKPEIRPVLLRVRPVGNAPLTSLTVTVSPGSVSVYCNCMPVTRLPSKSCAICPAGVIQVGASCPVTVMVNVRSASRLIWVPIRVYARTANLLSTSLLTSSGTPCTVITALGTPARTPVCCICMPAGKEPAISWKNTVSSSGSTATKGVL